MATLDHPGGPATWLLSDLPSGWYLWRATAADGRAAAGKVVISR